MINFLKLWMSNSFMTILFISITGGIAVPVASGFVSYVDYGNPLILLKDILKDLNIKRFIVGLFWIAIIMSFLISLSGEKIVW